MKSGWGKALATGLIAAGLAAPSVAQDEEPEQLTGGLVLNGDVVFGFEAEDNRALTANSSGTDTRLSAEVSISGELETERTSLQFTLGGSLQQENYQSLREENGFRDPFARVNYRRRGAGSELSFRLGYRKSELVDSLGLDLDGDLIDETFLRSVGDREFFSFAAGAEIGTDAPLGARIDVSHQNTDFTGQINPDVFDRTTDIVRISTFLRPRQTLTFGLFAEREEYEADDLVQTERTIDRLGVSMEYQINPILSFSGSISNDNIEERTTGGTRDDTGIGLDLELVRLVPDGQYTFFANRVLSTGISRTRFGVTRDVVMPRAEFGVTLGVSNSDTGDTVLFTGLNYSRPFPTGLLTAELTQDADVNSDDEEVLRTTFEVDYLHELSPTQSIGVGILHVRADDIGAGAVSEGDRTDIEFVYNRAVSRDWNWQAGFRHRRNNPSTGQKANSNAIFTTFGRSFSIRP